ncbi:centrosomal protein kizuna-like isoform X2 [Mya arenaria]|uniref:centrosomal protein kizuna-like isoform X2 n=1 Tax=Mya arenaria TaxID=6604 RepID=UPI0022E348AF|nr:centrosomal protein kizuna-like isoform X2 [Mya arenaria]
MASSNVEYYQKQKDLQDSIQENEQKRKRLEAQLQSYCQSDENMSKLRAVKLQSYWKRICEDEKRSRARNAQLLRDMDRMEANMASLEARREKLRHMKQQYFDYIERTYPQWLELVHQKKQEYMQQHQQQQYQQQQHYQQQQQQREQQIYQQQVQQQQQQQQQQQVYSQQSRPSPQGSNQATPTHPHRDSPQTNPKHQEAFLTQVSYGDENGESDVDAPPLPSSPPPPAPAAFGGAPQGNYSREAPEREYTNLKDIRREPERKTNVSMPQSVTVHMPSVQTDAGSPVKGGRPDSAGRSWLGAERDNSIHSVSYSEEVDMPINQPVQSVTVRQKNEPVQNPSAMSMDPVSDEDVSDFEEEPDLPSGAGENRGGAKPPSPTPEQDEDEISDQPPSPVHAEITMSGLMGLLAYVETDLQEALALEGYYRTRNPDENYRKHVIHKANSNGDLSSLDGELVSMVILQQLALVGHRLPGGCMLSDTLLLQPGLTEANIRDNLHRDAKSLWSRLLEHFLLLVRGRVMGTREVAHVFVPCLLHELSHYQEQAVRLLEDILEGLLRSGTGPVHNGAGRTSPGPGDSITLDTARSSQQGQVVYENLNYAVPRLKFGSLVDSKRFSDDESSMITQSMATDNGPKVPLNETEAYKTLVSGTLPRQQVAPQHDDTDNSDNELEKQVASTLSPRSTGSKPRTDPPVEVPTSAPLEESHDLSHDESHEQEPLSDLSSPLGPPVYVPTGAPTGMQQQSTLKSVLGSTGGSSQQRKLAGMISSDLDTDTEVDIGQMTQKKEEDDDDFYEFYG